MATSESLIHPAVAAKLNVIGVTSLVTGVFDVGNVPEHQAAPYIVLGETTEVPENTFGNDGQEVTIAIHIWSEKAGKKEANAIHDAIHTALDGAALTMSGYRCVFCLYENGSTLKDDTGDVERIHRTDRYRIRTEQA